MAEYPRENAPHTIARDARSSLHDDDRGRGARGMLKSSYKLLFTAVWVLIPLVVLVWRNAFRSRRATLARVIAAIVAAWAWVVATSLAVTNIDLALASTQAEVDRVVVGDGARHIGAIIIGFPASAVLTLAWWAAIRGYRAIRRYDTAAEA